MNKAIKRALISMSVVFVLLVTAVLVPYFVIKRNNPETPETPSNQTPTTPENPSTDPTTPDPTPVTTPFVYEKSEDGKYIYFGEYPQSLKEDDVTIVSTEPDENGYYLGSDGERYVKQKAIHWSYDLNGYDCVDALKYGFTTAKNGTVMEPGCEYYFKVEKIKWRVLSTDEESGESLIVCDTILKASAYQPNYTYVSTTDTENSLTGGQYYATTGGGVTRNQTDLILRDETTNAPIYANNYKYSELRRFLTTDFYNSAFTTSQKELIKCTEVDNSASTTDNATNKYVCENTNDYVFALSYADSINADYGFAGDFDDDDNYIADPNRAWETTDFAKATGTLTVTKEIAYEDCGVKNDEEAEASAEYQTNYKPYIGTGGFWLRSPRSSSSGRASDVGIGGFGSGCVETSEYGVVPALQISLKD